MRVLRVILIALVIAKCAAGASAENAGKSIRLAQSSATTTCMMSCNSQAASCQTSCVVPATSSNTATGTGNNVASQSCLSNCSSQQLACQTTCARTSPSE